MKEYHNGPIPDQKRRCTDTFCCILLAILVVVMFGIAIYSWAGNNFSKLTTPYDAEGKGCGVDYPDYPFIYFVSPEYDNLWRTVCVKNCPVGTETSLQCQPNKYVTSCQKVDNADSSLAVNIYETTPLRKSICLPSSQTLQKKISAAIGGQSWQGKIISLSKVWPILLASIPIAIFLSVIFMFFIRFTAGCFVYLLLGLSILACIGLGAYLIAAPTDSIAGVAMNRVFAITFGALLILFGILITVGVCCYRKRIRLASIIVQTSARFVKENCAISFLPLLLFVVLIAFLAVWILEALGYYSMGTPVSQDKQWPFQHFQTTNFVKVIIFVHVFQLFWVVCFLIETNDFIVSGAATSWYFQRQSPYSESTYRYRRFHIGSVALGSFFMALFGFLRFIYELLTPEKAEQEGCMANWKKFCDCCCFLCVSYIFNCFNSGAYTFIHLASDGYCASAWEVMGLRLKQPICTAVVAFMSVLFSILIRVGITALTVLVCYIIFKNADPYKTEVPDTTIANVIIGVIGFAISSFFVSLYSEAMEAIYVCYLVDKDAGGVEDKAPAELKDFLLEAKKQGHVLIE